MQSPDVQQERCLNGLTDNLVVPRVGLLREFGTDTVGRVYQPGGVDQSKRLNLSANCLGRIEDDGRFLHPSEDTASQPAEPGRARLLPRLEETAKRVEVVAVDADAFRRQDVDQVGVAMITDMEDLKIADEAAQITRVVPMTVQQSVGVDGRLAFAEPG